MIYFIERERKKSHSRKEKQPADSQRQKGSALRVHLGVAAGRQDTAVFRVASTPDLFLELAY